MYRLFIITFLSIGLFAVATFTWATTMDTTKSASANLTQTYFSTGTALGGPHHILMDLLVGATATKRQLVAALAGVQKMKRRLGIMKVKGELRKKRTKNKELGQAIGEWLEGVKQAHTQAETMEKDLKEMIDQKTEISYEELKQGIEELKSTVQTLIDTGQELAKAQ